MPRLELSSSTFYSIYIELLDSTGVYVQSISRYIFEYLLCSSIYITGISRLRTVLNLESSLSRLLHICRRSVRSMGSWTGPRKAWEQVNPYTPAMLHYFNMSIILNIGLRIHYFIVMQSAYIV